MGIQINPLESGRNSIKSPSTPLMDVTWNNYCLLILNKRKRIVALILVQKMTKESWLLMKKLVLP